MAAPQGRLSPVHFDDRSQADVRAPDQGFDSDGASTATNSSDEFDWFEDVEGDADRDLKAKRGRRLWLLFAKLSAGVRILLVGVLGSGIIITPYLVVLLKYKSSPVYYQVAAWSIWLSVAWAAGVITALVVNLLPRFIIWLMFFFWGKAPENVKTYIELLMAVSGWFKLALDISWLWISLGVVRSIIDPPGRYWVYVNRAVSALFSAGIILLFEKIVLQFVAIRFHRKSLSDRLIENQLGLRALDKLSVAPAQTRQQAQNKRKKLGTHSRDSSVEMLSALGHGARLTRTTELDSVASPADSVDHGRKEIVGEKKDDDGHGRAVEGDTRHPHHRHHHPHLTPKDRRRKRKKFTAAVLEQLGEAIGQVALKDSKFNRAGEIGSLYSARQLARQLFSNLASVTPRRDVLIVDDFYPYFRTHDEAVQAFHLFDKDDNGDISKKEMREAVQRIYRERKALTASLKDMSSAVAKLDGVLLAVALVAIIFVCLLIFNRSNTVESLVPLGTLVLGFSFIFGHSAQTLFESLIFIFSTHPFDVGDLVLIDDNPLVVKEFGLYATTFVRVDGQQIIAPNSILASTKLLHNVRRSGSMWETTNLQIAYDTPLTLIETLKTRLREYMAEHSREWGSPGCDIWVDQMSNQNYIQLIVAIEHRANWQDWGGRWSRRTGFMRHMKTVLEELDVGYRMPIQPVSFHPASSLPLGSNVSEFGNVRAGLSSTLGAAPISTQPRAGRFMI